MSRHLAKVLFPFLPSARRKMMELSDLLLPNSQSEAEQLQRFFRVPKEKIKTVPNGVDPSFADAKPDLFCSKYGIRDFVLTVGRIEPRKNQLQMIRALKGVKIPYVIIGDPVTQYWDYYRCCQTESGSNVHFLSALRHDSPLLASSYAACKVFLLASWLETPGLAAMEAALAGAKLVITNQGAAPEYFQDFASYVSPWSLSEIRETTLKALSLPSSLDLKNHVALHYLWNEVAVRTQDCYRSLMF